MFESFLIMIDLVNLILTIHSTFLYFLPVYSSTDFAIIYFLITHQPTSNHLILYLESQSVPC